jgi:hypothetical protein
MTFSYTALTKRENKWSRDENPAFFGMIAQRFTDSECSPLSTRCDWLVTFVALFVLAIVFICRSKHSIALSLTSHMDNSMDDSTDWAATNRPFCIFMLDRLFSMSPALCARLELSPCSSCSIPRFCTRIRDLAFSTISIDTSSRHLRRSSHYPMKTKAQQL